MKLFQFQCKQKSLSLILEVDDMIHPIIITDGNRIRQILVNLIGNAIKFTTKGGITIVIKNSPTSRSHISISVADTGIGIKDKDKKSLFKMYGKLEDKEGVNK